jgi:hypothetical protein
VLLVAAFALLRAYAALHSPVRMPDTGSYYDLDFLGDAIRLWTVPLFYKLLLTDSLRVAGQLLVGIAAWSTLAVTLHGTLDGAVLRRVAAVTVLVLGLTPQVTGWDATLMSESLAVSLLVLLTALLLRLRRQATPALLAACVVVAGLWVFSRQLNVICFLAVLPALIVLGYRWLPRRRAWATIAALIVIGAWGGYTLTGNQTVARWNALGLLELRIAVDQDALSFFEGRGLPQSPQILKERGAFLGSNSPLWQDTRLMRWMDDNFRATYAAYLLRHPRHTLTEPLRQAQGYVSSAPVSYVRQRDVVPSPVLETVWARSPGDVAFWVVVAFALGVAALARSLRVRFAAVAGLLLLATAVATFVTWHAGPGDFERVFMPVGVSLRLGLLLLIVFAIDALTRQRSVVGATAS